MSAALLKGVLERLFSTMDYYWKDYFQQFIITGKIIRNNGLVWERLFATMDYSWKDYLQQWIIIGKIVFNNGLFLERLFSTMHYTCELTNPR